MLFGLTCFICATVLYVEYCSTRTFSGEKKHDEVLLEILELNAIILLILSGLSYTLGTIFYSMKKKYAHTIWHLFVIAGSTFHFFLILLYII